MTELLSTDQRLAVLAPAGPVPPGMVRVAVNSSDWSYWWIVSGDNPANRGDYVFDVPRVQAKRWQAAEDAQAAANTERSLLIKQRTGQAQAPQSGPQG